MNPANNPLFGSDLWKPALEKYAEATHLTVKLFDADERVVLGPIHSTPLFQLFDEKGYDPGLFVECARRCLAQTENRPAVMVSQVHGLAVIGTSLVLDDKIVGAAVAGYAFVDFSQVSEIQRIARDGGIGFERLWQVAREQKPVPQGRLIVNGELLQVLADALLRENSRTRHYENTAAQLEEIVEDRTAALRELSSNLMRAQDDERRRISRELHDSIGQDLTGLKFQLVALGSAVEKLSPELAVQIEQNDVLVGRLCDNLRTMSYLLHPPMLDELGLRSAVNWYVDGFSERSGIQVKLNIPHKLQRLPETLELVLFRVLQEALTNIHRHAHSQSVEVQLRLGAAEVVLEVKDHGTGIPSDLLERLRSGGTGIGVGLRSMRERVSEVDGLFEIESGTNGTLIRATIPLSDTERKANAAPRKAGRVVEYRSRSAAKGSR